MVADFLFAGEVALELLKELCKLCKDACFSKDAAANNLKQTVEDLLPIIREIQYSGVELPQHRQAQLGRLVDELQRGRDLVRKAASSSRWNFYQSHLLSKKMERLEKSITRFLSVPMQAHLIADVHHMRTEMVQQMENVANRMEQALGKARAGSGGGECVEEVMRRVLEEVEGDGVIGGGMRVGKEKVKEMLLYKEEVRVVGICGIGGSGKTTLAKEICRDQLVQSFFKNRIVFETVSQSANIERLRFKIWQQIAGINAYNQFDHIAQWNNGFEKKVREPTLVVLDDVWSISQLEQLVFKHPGIKTLVVSRFRFSEVFDDAHDVELLGEEEALSLFCSSAFRQNTIPPTEDKRLVKQIVNECKGLPLALKVIGSSLRNQPPKMWESAKNKLSRGETISESHEFKLLERLAVSIGGLSSRVRECFLDLCSFPEDRKIPLDVLINIWAKTHDLDEVDAFAILIELADKNLVTLIKDSLNRAGDLYGSYNELSVTQHDVLRDLAMHMNNQDVPTQRKRLIMPRRENRIPKDWLRNEGCQFHAQIVSIHTGEMEKSDWFDMNFPSAEVLILNFTSSNYYLPSFIRKMPRLKSLVIVNYGNSTAALHNLSVFSSLYNLRSLWLEKIRVPLLPASTLPLPSLQKISLILCNFSESLNNSSFHLPLIFPQLVDLTVDHSIDLKELPSSICELQSLESLSISNCHDLVDLPANLGKLGSLQILRVYACPALEKLPQTISRLKRLKYLDVSRCVNLQDLPDGIGQLVNLEKIDMRECSLIMNLPVSTSLMRSLRHVICDEDISLIWKEAEKYNPDLRIQIAEEQFTLDWLVE